MTIVDVNGNGPGVSLAGPATMAPVGRHMIPLNGHPVTPPEPRRAWRWPSPSADTAILVLASVAVLAVIVPAAVVSYSHFYGLAVAHHQDGVAARLSPLSADGLIAAASLVMLNAVRRKLPVPYLARWMLAAGVVVTVAANVIYGLPAAWFSPVVSAWIGAGISAWPAVAFIGSVEMAVMFVRDARRDTTRDTARADQQRDAKSAAVVSQPKRRPVSGGDKVRAILAGTPGKPDKADIARRAGVSVRTVERVLEKG